jgi:hypothetical protein
MAMLRWRETHCMHRVPAYCRIAWVSTSRAFRPFFVHCSRNPTMRWHVENAPVHFPPSPRTFSGAIGCAAPAPGARWPEPGQTHASAAVPSSSAVSQYWPHFHPHPVGAVSGQLPHAVDCAALTPGRAYQGHPRQEHESRQPLREFHKRHVIPVVPADHGLGKA